MQGPRGPMLAARRRGFAIFGAILLAAFVLGYLLGRYCATLDPHVVAEQLARLKSLPAHVSETPSNAPHDDANAAQMRNAQLEARMVEEMAAVESSPDYTSQAPADAVQQAASAQPPTPAADAAKLKAAGPTLVIYAFAVTDAMSVDNLRFFVSRAIVEDDGVFYVIVVNLDDGQLMHTLRLPTLPHNAVYVPRKNECYDWGTYAWALASVPAADPKKYQYFIFINSSARGPFLHPMLEGRLHWTAMFTGALNNDTKLVGPTISCGGFCWERPGGSGKKCQKHPHVQSVALATDQVGLKVLQDSGRVLRCHADRQSAVFDGEVGASGEILKAGYNIASFLVRYAGVDFRAERAQKCNGGTSPLGLHSMDGLSPGALELVFPKVKQSLVESGHAAHVEALKMSQWMLQPSYKRSVGGNAANSGLQQHVEDVLVARTKGLKCFDIEFYRKKNPDLAARLPDPEQLFTHFLVKGMLDYREHRWTCGLDAAQIIPRFNPG